MDNTVKVAIIGGIVSILTLIITQSGYFEKQEPPAISDLIISPPGPQLDGTNITCNAIASDPNKDTIYYQFELKGPSTGMRYIVKQDWSEKSDWTWNSNDSDIGINYIRVSVKDKKHNEPSGNATFIENYSITDRKMTQGEIGYSKITKMILVQSYIFSAYVARSDSIDAARRKITTGTDVGEGHVLALNNTLIDPAIHTGSQVFISNVTIMHPEIEVDLKGDAFEISRMTPDVIPISVNQKGKNYGLWLWCVKPTEKGTHFLELSPYDVPSRTPIHGGGSIRIEVTVAEEAVNETAAVAEASPEAETPAVEETAAEAAEAAVEETAEAAEAADNETAEPAAEAAPGFASFSAIIGLLAVTFFVFRRVR